MKVLLIIGQIARDILSTFNFSRYRICKGIEFKSHMTCLLTQAKLKLQFYLSIEPYKINLILHISKWMI